MSARDEPSPTLEGLVPEPRSLGRYELCFRLGRGGMATVYLARLSSTQGFSKWVAVKTIHPHVADDAKYVDLFLDEARLAARINHPNVSSVFDFGEANGTYFLAMEYLHGKPLHEILKALGSRGGVPAPIAARIVADAAQGLHAAHELRSASGEPAGVIHRDVSPQNVFVLYDGIAKIVDFGIAKSNQSLREKTSTTELKGKLGYMAPEQLQDGEIDRRVDVWALGIVLWETMVGRRLFQRSNEIATVDAIARDPIPAPSSVRRGIPEGLERITMRALVRDPSKRYQTAAEMASDLERYLGALPAPVTHAEVASFVREAFADEIVARERELREAEQRPVVAPDAPENRIVPPTPISSPVSAPPAQAPSPETLAAFGVDRIPVPNASQPARPPKLEIRPDGNAGRTAWMGILAVGTMVVLAAALLYKPEHLAYFRHAVSPTALPPEAEDAGVVALGRDATVPSAASDASAPSNELPPPRAGVGERPLWHLPSTVGRLTLNAPAGARVLENGHSIGTTPLTEMPMRPGTHVLRVLPADPHAARTITVTIRAGQTTVAH